MATVESGRRDFFVGILLLEPIWNFFVVYLASGIFSSIRLQAQTFVRMVYRVVHRVVRRVVHRVRFNIFDLQVPIEK